MKIILDKLKKKLCLSFPGRERKFVFLKNSIFLSSLRKIIVPYIVLSYILFKANFSLNKDFKIKLFVIHLTECLT